MSEVESATNEIEVQIREAFDAAVEEGKSEDNVKMDMIGAGATFKNVTRLYNQFMIDAGLAISKEERDEIVSNTLEGKDISTDEGFDSAVAELLEAIDNSTERSAAAMVRAYGKKNEIEVYKKPKSDGGTKSSFASKYYDFLAANPGMEKEEAEAFIMGEGDHEDTTNNVKKHASHYLAIWKLANRIAAA